MTVKNFHTFFRKYQNILSFVSHADPTLIMLDVFDLKSITIAKFLDLAFISLIIVILILITNVKFITYIIITVIITIATATISWVFS